MRASRSPVAFRALHLATLAAGTLSVRLAGPPAARLWFTPWQRPRGEREARRRAEWLRGTRAVTFDAGGVELTGFESGTGPTVLLVHGWAEDSSAMGPLVGPLRAAGFRVVGVDLPAHGGSPGTTTNIYDSARALHSVADSLGEVFAVVAHSLGGAITVAALREKPWTRRAVMIASPVRLHGAVDRFSTMLRLPPKAVLGLERAIERRFGRGVWSDLAADSVAPGLGLEALIVHDRDDDQVPWGEAKMLADSWPGARFLLTSGLGHGKVLRDENVISAIVGFLSEDRAGNGEEGPARGHHPISV